MKTRINGITTNPTICHIPETLLVFKEPNNINKPVNKYTWISVGTKEVSAKMTVFELLSCAFSGESHPETNTNKKKIAISFMIKFSTSANKIELKRAKTRSLSNKFILTK
jgi:hypothetical protein